MTVTVYGLCSSENEIIRYIGQTVQDLRRRLSQHICYAKACRTNKSKGRHLCHWLLSVVDSGHEVKMVVLNADATLHETEIATIKLFRERGFSLVNATDGGEGTIGYHPLPMKRPWTAVRNKLQTGCKRGPLSEEHKKKLSDAKKGKKAPWLSERNRAQTGKPGRQQSEEERRKRSETLKGRVFTPEHRAKLSANRKGRKLSPEGIAKLRAGHKKYHDQRREAKLANESREG